MKALPTVVPISSALGGIVPSIQRFPGRRAKLADRGLLIVELGLALCDWLGRRHRAMPRHGVALRAATPRRFPIMAPAVIATSTYCDARVTSSLLTGSRFRAGVCQQQHDTRSAERLCYELAVDGSRRAPTPGPRRDEARPFERHGSEG